ncbi:MAG: 16S rRNA (guanine(527)-N(7))-methyltransferase RsmG [Solirubrobacteraceae bacterium]
MEATLARFGAREAAPRIAALLDALDAEPDPPTTVRDPASALDTHVADGLAGLEVDALRHATAIADVGAGAGFPGLALALALPGAHVDLIESARRKGEVIERLAVAAGASNARAVTARAEEWGAAEGKGAYGAVTVRALAPLAVVLEYAAPLLAAGGTVVAWKGTRDAGEERGGARAAAELGLRRVSVLRVEPFAGARDRHLHVFEKAEPTPDRFPRRTGVARKRPLG